MMQIRDRQKAATLLTQSAGLKAKMAEMNERADNWMKCQLQTFDEVNAAQAQVELAKASHNAAKSALKAARQANREAQRPVYCPDDQHKMKQLQALLNLRNAELKAIRSEAKVSRAVARLDAARQHRARVVQGEGFELAA